MRQGINILGGSTEGTIKKKKNPQQKEKQEIQAETKETTVPVKSK